MCGIYLLAGLYVLVVNAAQVPGVLQLIVSSAFNPTEAKGAFVGGSAGFAFLWGMKRALFSNEAGQGSSPIAHSAAKTVEPVREGVVAGLEPFIDTLVVCTLTALVVLTSGAWNRGPEATLTTMPAVVAQGPDTWTLEPTRLPPNEVARWVPGRDQVFMLASTGTLDAQTRTDLVRWFGTVEARGPEFWVTWNPLRLAQKPQLAQPGVFGSYIGAGLTSHAFDRVAPGTGRWLVTLVVWLFAISTLISWSYYGEQGMVYLFGSRSVTLYRVVYCLLILVACAGFITTDAALDNLTGLGTGVMLFANIPIMLLFGKQAMDAYQSYVRRLDQGEFKAHAASPFVDIVEGHDHRL
jgi:AGCS family alanine or glycine:cation symporter